MRIGIDNSVFSKHRTVQIKKQIFTYWHQGFEQAPPVVNLCVRRMQNCNPDWEVYLLDQSNIHDYIPALDIPAPILGKMSLAARSDLLRLKLLLIHGGVWMDPTVYCAKPLDVWLNKNMKAGLFMFQNPGPDRLVSSWFIAVDPEHVLLQAVQLRLDRYWKSAKFRNLGRDYSKFEGYMFRLINRRKEFTRVWFTWVFTRLFPVQPYFFFHYCIYDQIRASRRLFDIWRTMPVVDAGPLISIQRYGLNSPISERIRKSIDECFLPVFKLSWKQAAEGSAPDTVFSYLSRHSEIGAGEKVHN